MLLTLEFIASKVYSQSDFKELKPLLLIDIREATSIARGSLVGLSKYSLSFREANMGLASMIF